MSVLVFTETSRVAPSTALVTTARRDTDTPAVLFRRTGSVALRPAGGLATTDARAVLRAVARTGAARTVKAAEARAELIVGVSMRARRSSEIRLASDRSRSRAS